MPPVFYRAGKNTKGQNLTHLRGQYRQLGTSWLQGEAELTILAPAKRYQARNGSPPNYNGMRAQRRQSELTALSQALMLLIGALAVMLMLWMASGGVGGNTQPARSSRCSMAARWRLSRRLRPLPAHSSIWEQVIASALRITELTGKTGVTFRRQKLPRRKGHALTTTGTFPFRYRPAVCAQCPLSLQANRRACRYSGALPAAENQRCCSYSPAHGTRSKGEILLNDLPLSSLSESPYAGLSAWCRSVSTCSAPRCVIIYYWRRPMPPATKPFPTCCVASASKSALEDSGRQ